MDHGESVWNRDLRFPHTQKSQTSHPDSSSHISSVLRLTSQSSPRHWCQSGLRHLWNAQRLPEEGHVGREAFHPRHWRPPNQQMQNPPLWAVASCELVLNKTNTIPPVGLTSNSYRTKASRLGRARMLDSKFSYTRVALLWELYGILYWILSSPKMFLKRSGEQTKKWIEILTGYQEGKKNMKKQTGIIWPMEPVEWSQLFLWASVISIDFHAKHQEQPRLLTSPLVGAPHITAAWPRHVWVPQTDGSQGLTVPRSPAMAGGDQAAHTSTAVQADVESSKRFRLFHISLKAVPILPWLFFTLSGVTKSVETSRRLLESHAASWPVKRPVRVPAENMRRV